MLNDDKKLDKRTPNALNVCNSVEGGDWLRFSLKFPASHESKVGEKRKLRNTLRNKNLRTYVGGGGVEGVIRKFEAHAAICHCQPDLECQGPVCSSISVLLTILYIAPSCIPPFSLFSTSRPR